MNIILIYIVGLAVIGLINSLLFEIDSIYNVMDSIVDKAKEEIGPQADLIENHAILRSLIITSSIFSWLGIIYTLLIIGCYIEYKLNNKNTKNNE